MAPQLDASIRDTLVEDLSCFPAPWLDFLGRYGLQIVALEEGQTLADSPVLAQSAVRDVQDWSQKAQEALLQSQGGDRYQRAENLQLQLLEQGSPMRAATHGEPIDLMKLAEQRQVAAAFRPGWVESLQQLNAPWSSLRDGLFVADQGVFLLPPVPTDFGLVADRDYQEAVSTTAHFVAKNLGVNQGPEQRVLLHPRFLPHDAAEIGQYRVAIHEVGHALDYALQGLPEDSGFGSQHSARVLACFEQAEVFTSDRADDDPREYFAEAVEAYLTSPSTAFDFRPQNHQTELRQRDPQMAAYLDRVFATVPGPDWASRPPQPRGMPEGFPDPDRDAIFLP